MKGSFHQSRRQSNFYNGMKPDQQESHAKQWVAAINNKLLEPFIKITGATKHNREVFYEIDIKRLLNVEEENKRLREIVEEFIEYCATTNDVRPLLEIVTDARQALAGESNEH